MISSEIQHFLNLADESHEVAKELLDRHPRFSVAQSYYTVFIWHKHCYSQKA